METKEDGDVQEDWSTPASPIVVLQKLSEEAVRRAGEALHGAYTGSPIFKTPPQLDPAPRHRRARSEVASTFHKRSGSGSGSTSGFQKWKGQMQRALHWNSSSFREGSQFPSFDPEILANQKRQWYQLQSKTLDHEKYKEPTSLFEHFIVAGLHPDANLEVVEDAFIRRKKWEKARAEMLNFKMQPHQQPTLPKLEPQVLFKYPPGKKLALRLKDLAAFCFPEGVKAQVLEKTPSLSELNELVYGQEHLFRDDLSFIFSLKVADNATLYGVCLHVKEFVQKPHAISGFSSGPSHSGCNRFLVPAPRCYCFLTRVPFFELHFEILNSIISQDRLNRITQFVSDISFADNVPTQSVSKVHTNGNADSSYEESDTDWMASAIPVNSAVAVTAAAAGIITEDDVPSSSGELNFPTANDSLDSSQFRRLDNDGGTNMHYFDNCSPKAENQSSDIEQTCRTQFNSHTPDGRPNVYLRTQSFRHCSSFEALFSSARSMASEMDDDETFSEPSDDPSDDTVMEWARESKNDLLQLVCGYHSIPLPPRGGQIIFRPLEHLQAAEYRRPPISALGLCENYLDMEMKDCKKVTQVKLKLAAAEEAASLSLWTTATICRVLSLESILALVTGVLLEKQVVVLCPNLGVLSALVLSIIPIIRPFEWQSLFLPIGIQHKIGDLKKKTSDLVRVNVIKNQVKTGYLPLLPRRKELISELGPFHSLLSRENPISRKHQVYKCNEVQTNAAAQFLLVMRQYMESLCADFRSHTITSVQSIDDRVSILLKDSFIDSFPVRDQSFIELFVETQLFTVLSDSRLSSFENGYPN
ncbi:uncharacterized protein [Henckelia pumila]|uniref:uncharacterized protein isoform X2 n=1 Tax=Henckelia pumila TaxID=405737 RepID=UPI003C6E6E79